MAAVEDTKNTETTETEDKIEISVEPIKFNAINDTQYLTSREFCEMVSSVFRPVFADYEGCRLEGIPGTPMIGITLWFNHQDYSQSEMPVACTRDKEGTQGSGIVASVRRYSTVINNGDRYYATKQAQDAIAPFLSELTGIVAHNGKINWGKVVSEKTDPASINSFYGAGQRKQCTVFSFLDPNKLATLFYGADDTENGAKWVYGVRIARSIPALNAFGVSSPNNWILAIDRISATEVENLANKFGLSGLTTSGIVR